MPVYFERRRRENRRDRVSGEHRLRVATDWAFGYFGGYGVALPRIVGALTGLTFLGTLVFLSPHSLQPVPTNWWRSQFPPPHPSVLDAFAVSVHQLLPISVAFGDGWRLSGLTAAYALVHRLIGSTLLSLGVAALIGLLHRRTR
jgi:hypothetical protein